LFYICAGNFGFLHLLTIVLNLSNFDDDFLVAVIPHKLLKVLECDCNALTIEVPLSESEKQEKLKQKEESKSEPKKSTNPYDIVDEDDEPKQTSNKTNPYDIKDDEEDDEINVVPHKELTKIVPRGTNFLQEILSFFNIFCVIIIWTFHWLFPFKNLATGYFKVTKNDFLYYVNNNTLMNIYMAMVFLYIVGKYIWNHIEELSIEFDQIVDQKKSVLKSSVTFFFNFFSKILFIVFVALYFLGSLNSFYKGNGLKISSKFFKGGLNLSQKYFNRFHILNHYGNFFKKLSTDRYELEIKYTEEKDIWKSINFNYKPSLNKNSLSLIIPHMPRLDWQFSVSAYSKSIESDPYLVLLIGKILEKNPVTLDLLGYRIEGKEPFYKSIKSIKIVSLIDSWFPKVPFTGRPSKLKIDLYKYYFSTREDFQKNKQYWKKTLVKEYFVPVGKPQIQKVFENYSLPRIDEYRDILISPFQLINIVDLVIIILFIYVVKNIFTTK
jgi:hypothetical protein